MMLRLDCETVRKTYMKILRKNIEVLVRALGERNMTITIKSSKIESKTQLIQYNESIMKTVTILFSLKIARPSR